MEKKIRPVLVTFICVIGFIGVILSFPSIFSPFVKKMGDFYPALFGCLIAANFIAVVGVWNMKRWGFTLFLISSLINQITKLLANNWSITDVILPVLFLGVTVFFYKRMDDNL